MPARRRPETFVCKGCDRVITRAPSPVRDMRKDYCSLACKMTSWWRTHHHHDYPQQAICKACGTEFTTTTGAWYCSDACKATKRKQKQVFASTCVQCGQTFVRGTRPQATCSAQCRVLRLREQLRGKKYRPMKARAHQCARCGKEFQRRRRDVSRRPSCVRRLGDPTRGKPEARAKRAGVPYVRGIKPEQVFDRDRWRCHLCGCRTPKHLRGKNKPTSPEVDHIVPLSAGGGHTWDNVACACRSCNMRKSNKPLGQQRLAI